MRVIANAWYRFKHGEGGSTSIGYVEKVKGDRCYVRFPNPWALQDDSRKGWNKSLIRKAVVDATDTTPTPQQIKTIIAAIGHPWELKK